MVVFEQWRRDLATPSDEEWEQALVNLTSLLIILQCLTQLLFTGLTILNYILGVKQILQNVLLKQVYLYICCGVVLNCVLYSIP